MLYFKEFNKLTKSVLATILFLQCNYWFEKMRGRPFYKFTEPCDHLSYQKKHSWTEELGFSISEFRSCKNKVITKLRKGKVYDLKECGLILSWSGGNNLTMYSPNYVRMFYLEESAILEKHFPTFQKWKSTFQKSEFPTSEIKLTSSRKSLFDFPYIQEITQKNNSKNYAGESSDNFLDKKANDEKEKNCEKKKNKDSNEEITFPFESSEFKNIWEQWKKYKKEVHNFDYSFQSEQASLFQVQNYDEEFAKNLILDAIGNNWKAFHFSETLNKFQNWKKNKSYGQSKIITSTGEEFEPHVAEVLQKYNR